MGRTRGQALADAVGVDDFKVNDSSRHGSEVKIAIASLYLPSGSKIGVGYQVHGLSNALVRRGHDVTVFSPCSLPNGASYTVRTILPGRRLRTFGFAWDLRKADFSGFDVLNAHGDDWFLWGVRRPWHVHTYHGSCLAEMLNIDGLTGKLRMGMLALCEQQSVLLPDETVAVSENTRRYVKGIEHVIPCGVDITSFRPSGDRSPQPSILFVGTMHGRKRGKMLLDLFKKEIQSQMKELQLWCVCDPPDGETSGDGVQFLGAVDHETLTDLYRRAWVFCLPSTYEGFGVPYIEAMASGTPVVASPNPGACEVLGNGRWGVVCPDDQLATQLLALLGDSQRRQSLQVAGVERAQEFSWESVCTRYEELYLGNK